MDVNTSADMNVVKEGRAEVYYPGTVFYNPVQEFNRDITVAVISLHAKEHMMKVMQKEKEANTDMDVAEGGVTERGVAEQDVAEGDVAEQDVAEQDVAEGDVAVGQECQQGNGEANGRPAGEEHTETDMDVGNVENIAVSVKPTPLKPCSTKPVQKNTAPTSHGPSGSLGQVAHSTGNDIVDDMAEDTADEEPEDAYTWDEHDDIELQSGVQYLKGIRVLEALAASGLRSVRFGLEIPGLQKVIANDFDQTAVEYIKNNVKHNNLDGIVEASYADAGVLMYQHRSVAKRFDVIDLDPYGTPAPFLDAAVQAVSDGGLLCVTCTDTAVLCGHAGETCYSKYGAMSLRAKYCHEMALRIVLQSIESHANRHSRFIVPLVSLSVDFYVRIFVRIQSGQGKVKQSVSKLALVYHCSGCGTHTLQRLGNKTPTGGGNFKYQPGVGPPVTERCTHCGNTHWLGGPIWADPIHNTEFVKRLLDYVSRRMGDFTTSNRIMGMLTLAQEELPDVPLYYSLDELCRLVHCSTPTVKQFRSALLNAGYKVTNSHALALSVKTNAPSHVLWDIIRAWVALNPITKKRLVEGSVAKAILDKPAIMKVSFDLHPDAIPASKKKGYVRYQVNPTKDWGPQPKAKRVAEALKVDERRRQNQGKRGKRGLEFLKRFPCKKQKRGECDLGDMCRYTHDMGDNSVPASVEGDNSVPIVIEDSAASQSEEDNCATSRTEGDNSVSTHAEGDNSATSQSEREKCASV